jgi:hypothetical protein
MQAKVTPTAGWGDQRGAELVTKAQRRHDLAISGAASAITAGDRVQRRHVAGPGAWNLLTSFWPNSLSRNRSAAPTSGSSANMLVTSSVVGSAVAR